jgi:glycerol uptake facilitator protein
MGSVRCCALLAESASEFVGTFLLVFLGCASSASSVLTAIARARKNGVWEYESASTAVAWGIALGVATLVASPVSGAHLNPAVTVSLAVSRGSPFQKRKVIPYVGAQLLGAVSAALAVLGVYGSAVSHFEHPDDAEMDVFFPRGADNSTVTAMALANYFPNPIAVKSGVLSEADVSTVGAFVLEAMGTMLFVLLMRVLTEESRYDRRSHVQAAFAQACCLSVLMIALNPVIQVSLNPARDLGPRIVAYIAGWSTAAIPGPGTGIWAYQTGPFVGAGVATLLYDFGLQRISPSESEQCQDAHCAELEHAILGGPDKSATLGLGSLAIDPGKGLHHSDFRDSPTPHGHSNYRLSSPAALTQTFLRQQLDLV